MKTKATLIAVLLAAAGTTWANGGRSFDSLNVNNVQPAKAEITEINVQEPTEQFDARIKNTEKVNTSALKQSYGSNGDVSYDSLNDVL